MYSLVNSPTNNPKGSVLSTHQLKLILETVFFLRGLSYLSLTYFFRREGFYLLFCYSCQHSLFRYVVQSIFTFPFHLLNVPLPPSGSNFG